MKKGTLAHIKRYKLIDLLNHKPIPTEPWVCDCRSFDIPNTITAMIKKLNENCVAITLSPRGGKSMIKWAEHEARKKNIRILWWTY